MTPAIKTNHQYRNVLSWYELSLKEQAGFDYLATEAQQDEAEFARYRGVVYDLHEFSRTSEIALHFDGMSKWHGYQSDSYFSGVLIRYSADFSCVKMGTYYS